jgi:hypothetical protein
MRLKTVGPAAGLYIEPGAYETVRDRFTANRRGPNTARGAARPRPFTRGRLRELAREAKARRPRSRRHRAGPQVRRAIRLSVPLDCGRLLWAADDAVAVFNTSAIS